ncbi:tripartite tricarboxylate transporter substrate binding protein [Cupriavidus sp. MP-37]|uniref:Bug family tripartite tricarboxylate transporter substrate binding protein n=1 Tax=Cupriavidus sp. MP-37 TaxID=2884455 RepID=UPI001D0A0A44|nr:tripartite tricarboxylate transporter substrate binding protein [Cupriavidus sp. MP-37]UDM49613.1 tripartite tricarboxylate transporter substrate binding protein [Cupriavidus sp. MP-37]
MKWLANARLGFAARRHPYCAAAVAIAASMMAVATPSTAHATYPDRPIRLVVPYTAGGGGDALARMVAARMSTFLKQPIVVENVPGAGGTIGANKVARAAPDGYTMLLGVSGTHVIAPSTFPRLPYDPLRDFIPVSRIAYGGNVLVANPAFSAHSLPELIALARKPGADIAYGSWGEGSGGHLAVTSINVAAKIQLRHVPYKGASPVLADVMGGILPIGMSDTTTALSLIKAGKLRPLAVSGAERSPALPDIPTFAECGIPLKLDIWFGLFAPANTPEPIVDLLEKAAHEAAADPSLKARVAEFGLHATQISRAAFAEQMRIETRTWADLVKATGVKFN